MACQLSHTETSIHKWTRIHQEFTRLAPSVGALADGHETTPRTAQALRHRFAQYQGKNPRHPSRDVRSSDEALACIEVIDQLGDALPFVREARTTLLAHDEHDDTEHEQSVLELTVAPRSLALDPPTTAEEPTVEEAPPDIPEQMPMEEIDDEDANSPPVPTPTAAPPSPHARGRSALNAVMTTMGRHEPSSAPTRAACSEGFAAAFRQPSWTLPEAASWATVSAAAPAATHLVPQQAHTPPLQQPRATTPAPKTAATSYTPFEHSFTVIQYQTRPAWAPAWAEPINTGPLPTAALGTTGTHPMALHHSRALQHLAYTMMPAHAPGGSMVSLYKPAEWFGTDASARLAASLRGHVDAP